MGASIVNSLGQEMDFEAAMGLDTDQEYRDTCCRPHEEKYGEEFAPDCGAAR